MSTAVHLTNWVESYVFNPCSRSVFLFIFFLTFLIHFKFNKHEIETQQLKIIDIFRLFFVASVSIEEIEEKKRQKTKKCEMCLCVLTHVVWGETNWESDKNL